MLSAGVVHFDVNGRIRNTQNPGQPIDFNGGTPTKGATALLAWTNNAPQEYLGALGYVRTAELSIVDSTGIIAGYAPGGIPMDANGHACVVFNGVIDHYNAGLPCDSLGRMVLADAELPS